MSNILQALGARLREYRKNLGLSSTVTAESAQISRMTLHRIEKGESSVTMGAYLSVISALGLRLELINPHLKNPSKKNPLPKKIKISDYPQLKRLAWQLKKTKTLTPEEVLEIYERNWRHVEIKKLSAKEKKLIEKILSAFGKERLLV